MSYAQHSLPLAGRKPTGIAWHAPADTTILAAITGVLWIITIAWQGVDIDAILGASLQSDRDAWIFALTLAPLYFAVKGVAAAWGVIIGVATCLLAGQLLLHRAARWTRWLIAGGATVVIFIGVPVALNAQENARLTALYRGTDAARLPDLAGRAVELPSKTRIGAMWQLPLRCPRQCVDLLNFGRAASVTLSLAGREGDSAAIPIVQTYQLGAAGRGCTGETLNGRCPHLVSQTVPSDRVILTIVPVSPQPADAGSVVVRRLYATDTRAMNGRPAERTALRFAGYPGLLDIHWRDKALFLPRSTLPFVPEAQVEADLYRAVAPNRTLDGGYFPFR